MTSTSQLKEFYGRIFSDLKVDWSEASELEEFLTGLSPSPDIVTLRATAFRVGCDYLSDDRDDQIALLRTINYIVHSIEQNCMEPKSLQDTVPLDEEATLAFYSSLYEDLTVDYGEKATIFEFFQSHPPETDTLVNVRALAFKAAFDYLSEDKENNVKLLRCINYVVHAFEKSCLQAKPATLKLDEGWNLADMTLSEAVQHLWDVDANRLEPGSDYKIDVQKGKKPYWKEDKAHDPLFSYVDPSIWKRPTYAAFRALLDNYISETGVAEVVTDAERREIWTFLHAVMNQAAMQFCFQYCHAKDPNNVPGNRESFLKLLHKIWFDLYRRERGGRLDSSGFEHVFIGEVKDGKVTGFHNWIQFWMEEQAGELDYRGYIKPRGKNEAETDDNDHLLTLQFHWKGVEKSVGSSFIGVSPEFELALYTMCFLVGDEENHIELNTGTDVFGLTVKCYKIARGKIGTAFPMVTSHYDE